MFFLFSPQKHIKVTVVHLSYLGKRTKIEKCDAIRLLIYKFSMKFIQKEMRVRIHTLSVAFTEALWSIL